MNNQNEKGGFSSVCEKCGRTIYEGEMLNISGKYVCEPCAEKCVFGEFSSPRRKRKTPSSFLHFIFSFHPGAGQMYLGLMKRGLFQMCLFYFCIYLISMVSSLFFGLLIPVICIYSFFDSLSLKRRIMNGEDVYDELGGVAEFLSNNRGLVIIAIVIMLLIGFISSALGFIADNYFVRGTPPSPSSGNRIEIYVDEAIERAIEDSGMRYDNGRPEYGRRGTITYSYSRASTLGVICPVILIGIGIVLLIKSGRKRRRCGGAPPTRPDSSHSTYDVYDSNE